MVIGNEDAAGSVVSSVAIASSENSGIPRQDRHARSHASGAEHGRNRGGHTYKTSPSNGTTSTATSITLFSELV